MTQDESWLAKYDEVVAFILREKRNPSKYDAEERGRYGNWLRHNRKVYNAGEMIPPQSLRDSSPKQGSNPEERFRELMELMELMERHRHKNQYE